MFSAKQGNYWYHFYNAVLDWGLNPGPPALEASTLPLGYRGGGIHVVSSRGNRLIHTFWCIIDPYVSSHLISFVINEVTSGMNWII